MDNNKKLACWAALLLALVCLCFPRLAEAAPAQGQSDAQTNVAADAADYDADPTTEALQEETQSTANDTGEGPVERKAKTLGTAVTLLVLIGDFTLWGVASSFRKKAEQEIPQLPEEPDLRALGTDLHALIAGRLLYGKMLARAVAVAIADLAGNGVVSVYRMPSEHKKRERRTGGNKLGDDLLLVIHKDAAAELSDEIDQAVIAYLLWIAEAARKAGCVVYEPPVMLPGDVVCHPGDLARIVEGRRLALTAQRDALYDVVDKRCEAEGYYAADEMRTRMTSTANTLSTATVVMAAATIVAVVFARNIVPLLGFYGIRFTAQENMQIRLLSRELSPEGLDLRNSLMCLNAWLDTLCDEDTLPEDPTAWDRLVRYDALFGCHLELTKRLGRDFEDLIHDDRRLQVAFEWRSTEKGVMSLYGNLETVLEFDE